VPPKWGLTCASVPITLDGSPIGVLKAIPLTDWCTKIGLDSGINSVVGFLHYSCQPS